MALKTVVKVGNISNLSDARYCAGMGVDFLGFRVHASDPNYVAPDTFQEFRGWFSGPKVVAELYGTTTPAELTAAIEAYSPDYLEVGLSEIDLALATDKPLILTITQDEYKANKTKIDMLGDRIEYLHLNGINSVDQINPIFQNSKTLVQAEGIPTETINHLISKNGIALSGSSEDKPGFKTYDGLAEILELLEEED